MDIGRTAGDLAPINSHVSMLAVASLTRANNIQNYAISTTFMVPGRGMVDGLLRALRAPPNCVRAHLRNQEIRLDWSSI